MKLQEQKLIHIWRKKHLKIVTKKQAFLLRFTEVEEIMSALCCEYGQKEHIPIGCLVESKQDMTGFFLIGCLLGPKLVGALMGEKIDLMVHLKILEIIYIKF